MKFLAIDYGQKRVGLAVSDQAGAGLAFPLRTIRRETREVFFAELLDILRNESIEAVVIGLPLHVDGATCLATRQTQNFAGSLKRRITLPLYWMNEVLSSFEAEKDLQQVGVRPHKMAEILDQQAAVRILQSFLAQPQDRWMTI